MRAFSKTRGFTLIEVMVAISIFAVISAGIYHVLSAMVDVQGKVVKHAEALHEVQKAMWVISSDIEQIVMRDVHAEADSRSPAMISDEDNYLLQFTRQGISNPLLFNRSDMLRVAYSLGARPEQDDGGVRGAGDSDESKGQHLLRTTWLALDRISSTKTLTQVLLRDVESVKIEFLLEENKWLSLWPEKQPDRRAHTRDLPIAIKITINAKNAGEIQRVFQIGNLIEKKKKVPQP